MAERKAKLASFSPWAIISVWRLGRDAWSAGEYREAITFYQLSIGLCSDHPVLLNDFAWHLVTCPDPTFRKVAQAVASARKATELEPKVGTYWNTLGVVLYRKADWPGAVTALEKSMELRRGGDSFDWFFLAMAHGQLGNKEEARKRYDQAVQWMEKNQPQNEELRRFRAEAAELLGIKEKRISETSLTPNP